MTNLTPKPVPAPRIYTCGGCKLPYATYAVGPESARCPRCNPGGTLNALVGPPQFAAQRDKVYQGPRLVARAVSATFARRIVEALKRYQPGPKGY